MNDRLFWLFLGLTIFAVFYAVFMGYIFYQDSKHKIVRSKKGNILVIFLAVALALSTVAISYLFIQNRQLQNQKIQPGPPVQNPAPAKNFPVPTPTQTPPTNLLRACPEEWYISMPSIVGSDNISNEYFVYKGVRRELSEFDVDWVKINCSVKPVRVQ